MIVCFFMQKDQMHLMQHFIPSLFLTDCRSPKPSSYLHWQAHYLKRVTESIRRLQYFHAKSVNCMQRRSCISTLLGEPRFKFMKLIILQVFMYTHQCLSIRVQFTTWLSLAKFNSKTGKKARFVRVISGRFDLHGRSL